MIVCPSCQSYVPLAASGGLPPWCPKCGADLKGGAAPKPPPPPAPAPLPTVQPVEDYDPQLPPLEVPVVQVQPMAAPRPAARAPRPRDPYDDDDDYNSPQRVAEESAWKKVCKECAGVLFAIAGLQIVCGLAFGAIGGAMVERELLPFVVGVMVFLGVVFAGLGWWALYQPFAPSLIGLLLYVGVALLDLYFMVQQGQFNGGILIRVAIAGALLQATIKAANAVRPSARRRHRW